MSVTIDSLDIQIRSSAGSAKQNIEDLAKALERLNGASKVTKIVNSLDRLNGALTNLRSNSGVMGQLSSLSQSLARLANIPKLTGLQSAIRELKKLPQVMNDLDGADIAQFTLRLKQLAAALTPLATQLDRIGTAFGKLPGQVSKVVTATNRMTTATNAHGNALNHQSLNLMSAYQNLQDYLSMLHFVGDAISKLMNDAIEWDGIQSRFGRAFGDSAQESLDWVNKLSEGLMINKQEFMQYSSLFAEMLSGFGVNQRDAGKMAIGYTELAYDIWAAYNDVYKSLGGEEGAIAAVRSAIAGEVEPIRRAGFTIVDSQLAVTAANHGLTYSTQKATEAQKSYLRYVTLVDQAIDKNIIGVYAAEMQTAEGAVRTLSQQIKTLGQAIGSLFLPILQAVVPYLTVFVQLLYDAAEAVAKFFGLPFFETDWSRGVDNSGLADFAQSADASTEALGGAAKAAKKLKSYTMGFDELNIIDPTSGASGGAGSGGVGDDAGWDSMNVDSIWDESLFKQASQQVNELKAQIESWFEEWKVQIAIIGGALAALSMSKMLGQLGEALGLGDKFLNTMNLIGKLASTAIVITLQYSLMTEFLSGYLDGEGFKEYIKAMFVGALGTWVLYSMWGPAGLVIGFSVIAAASLSAIIDDGGINSMEGFVTALTGVAAAAGAVWVAVKKLKIFEKVTEWIRPAVRAVDELVAAFKGLPLVSSSPLLSKLSGVFRTLGSAVSAVAGFFGLPVWATIAAIITVIGSSAYFLYENWEKVKNAVKTFFDLNIAPKLEEIAGYWDDIKKAIEPLTDAFAPLIESAKEFIEGIDWTGVLSAIGTFFEWIGGIITSVIGGVAMGVLSVFVSTIENVIQIVTGVIQTISGVIQFVVALFTGGDVTDAAQLMIDGIGKVFSGLWGLVSDPIEEFWNGVVDWFMSLYDELVGHSIVPDMIDAVVEWFISLPGKILGPLKTFCEDVLKRFRDMWTDVKGWYNTNVAPKFTKEFWVSKFTGLKEGFVTTVKNMINAAIDKLNQFIDWANDALKIEFDGLKNPLTNDWIIKPMSIQLATIPKIPYFAEGGFPAMGQMFVAREAGPELVGRMGRRNAVVNNDQIVDGVAAGVYRAVIAAMTDSNSGSGQAVNVYLDGKQIYSSMKKAESERGLTLVGNQLGYAY